MALTRWPWGLSGALLAATYLHAVCVSAGPAINIRLRAPFSSAPYLLELLETAADENATSYFPLLDRIANGHFAKEFTDKELYEKFVQTLQEDGHITDSESLSSYQYALSTRSSAPRIEAHYQYYHTAAEPSLLGEQDTSCPVWVLFNGKQYCSPTLEEPHGDIAGDSQTEELQFDRVIGSSSSPASVLYADITSPLFGKFHNTLIKTAREGKTSYRIRHRKSLDVQSNPLIIPGYGVELALKRTDYIVIDDREADSLKSPDTLEKEVKFEDEELADLKPLSTSELSSLGLKAATFILQSESPFDALVKLTQDFPKYSSAIASQSISNDFVKEHEFNRAQLVPAGYNVWWMNGVQTTERSIGALSILDALRKERKLINGVRELGLSGPEAIQLLSHTNVSYAKAENEVQRFDWRDTPEGGNVIIWLNDIAKDTRYDGWPESLQAFLQRTYPGQLPQVRRECFDIILPINFSDSQDVNIVVDTLISFVKRKLAIRIGLVPLSTTSESTEQAKVLYHLMDSYGLSAAIAYLETSYESNKLTSPHKASFETAVTGKTLKVGKTSILLTEVLHSDAYNHQIQASKSWVRRLSADTRIPPMFVDGAALPRDENWLQGMSTRVTADLQAVQQAIFQDEFTEASWLPDHFLEKAVSKRNSLITPEDEKTLKLFDINKVFIDHKDALGVMPRLEVNIKESPKSSWGQLIVIVDLDTQAGAHFITTANFLRQANTGIEIIIVHNPASKPPHHSLSNTLFSHVRASGSKPLKTFDDLAQVLGSDWDPLSENLQQEAAEYWHKADAFVKSLTLLPGQHGLMLNGRLVGPIPDESAFEIDDFEQLISYEITKRIAPTYAAMESLGLTDKILDPLIGAKLSSIVALSTKSDAPEGIFDSAPTMRMSQFDIWNTTHTTIELGDRSTATVQITVLVDPASQQGQRWIPILKVLSELDGIAIRIFLNPKERLSELPIKRFYRYVLESKPTFDEAGSLTTPGASFIGVPQEALLTVGMDVPPAWLVAPKVSVQDLDNIKLSSIKTNVDALYELEHILIEGHSREIPGGAAPRGVQLVLGTERDHHTADTIVMANLGYFQFKANPGYYKIDLQKGRSAEIFNIDSVGAQGWAPIPGDESADVVLMSFEGATIYPRLSRKDGMDGEDVLEAKGHSKMDFMSRGFEFAQGILGKGKAVAENEHADINIFSVASGHLYERMLNIMMVSVMKHTKHTVKFWFIEQFLSPSFKDFIPHLAAEYGFKYEMVTYKWPHWLRAQTEKQREIWGYKILFLDVLFPLSLDKVIFVDADQIVRTDMIELVNHDLQGAPYGFTPMCDSRTEMEGFRFWKQGYWEKFLRGLPYHISALYVVDLVHFRQIAAGDRLRQQYHSLSADPNSLSNLDQDLPNHMQSVLPIHSLPQEWLWCETWCSDESLTSAKTIDLCNNPMTKEPKLDRARRQVPEWIVYDNEIAAVDRKRKGSRDENATKEKNTKSRTLEEENPHTKKDEL